MSIVDSIRKALHSAPPTGDPSAAPSAVADLDKAILAASPRANVGKWLLPLSMAFTKFDMTTPRRIAGALGQFAVEAGADLSFLIENTNYTTPERLVAMFSAFRDIDTARAYAGKPEAIANRAYANRNGNGDEKSGDGWRYRGRGLIQLTGKDTYRAFGIAVNLDPIGASVYAATTEGAAVSGVWFLTWKHLQPALDAWDLASVTRAVNGRAMTQHAQRVQAAERALATLTA